MLIPQKLLAGASAIFFAMALAGCSLGPDSSSESPPQEQVVEVTEPVVESEVAPDDGLIEEVQDQLDAGSTSVEVELGSERIVTCGDHHAAGVPAGYPAPVLELVSFTLVDGAPVLGLTLDQEQLDLNANNLMYCISYDSPTGEQMAGANSILYAGEEYGTDFLPTVEEIDGRDLYLTVWYMRYNHDANTEEFSNITEPILLTLE